MIAGYVLAGGKSSRLGTDKTQLRLLDMKVDLLHQTYACAQTALSSCWVVCRKEQNHPDLPCINDHHEGIGPIAGILAALLHAKKQHFSAILALSCDLPFINHITLEQLIMASRQHPQTKLTAFFNRQTQKAEMLAALYTVSSIPLFINAIKVGHFKLNRIIPWTQRTILFSDPQSERALFNINTPDDLRHASNLASHI